MFDNVKEDEQVVAKMNHKGQTRKLVEVFRPEGFEVPEAEQSNSRKD